MNGEKGKVENMMNNIIEQCSQMNVYENRSKGDKYYELVFFSKELSEWEKIFTDAMGEAVKPSNAAPTKDDLKITEDHGGICKNQTLFKKEQQDATLIAMFWPWQDNIHITLKVAVVEKK